MRNGDLLAVEVSLPARGEADTIPSHQEEGDYLGGGILLLHFKKNPVHLSIYLPYHDPVIY